MTDHVQDVEEVEIISPQEKEPVDRSRRFNYIAAVTAFSLTTALFMTILALFWGPTTVVSGVAAAAPYSPLVDLYVRGALGIASATVIAYVSGSVIDYNGGIGKLFSSKPKG